jgi:hypothetical protein
MIDPRENANAFCGKRRYRAIDRLLDGMVAGERDQAIIRHSLHPVDAWPSTGHTVATVMRSGQAPRRDLAAVEH